MVLVLTDGDVPAAHETIGDGRHERQVATKVGHQGGRLRLEFHLEVPGGIGDTGETGRRRNRARRPSGAAEGHRDRSCGEKG